MNYKVHETAIIDDGAKIGANSRIWQWVHVCAGAQIGCDVSLGQNVFVGNKVIIGDKCKIQNNVSVYDNVYLEEGVFCGPSMVFTNVYNPRSLIERKDEYQNTFIKKALENQDVDYSEILNSDSLKGFSGLLFTNESPGGPAKLLKDFRKSLGADYPLLKAVAIDSDFFIGDDHLDLLSKLKSKNELIGDVILLLQSPAKNIISLLKSSENKISGVLKALANK